MYQPNRFFAIVLLIMVSQQIFSQQNGPKRALRFHSINNVGLLEGQTGSAFQIQSVNGVQLNSWFAGLGVGIDYYRFRTIPLFADFRKEFGRSGSKPFIYADLGFSLPWVKDNQKSGYPDESYKRGFYNDFGLGYKAKISKHEALLVSVGYSYKRITETYQPVYYYWMNYTDIAPGNSPAEKMNYGLNRLSVKIGFEF